ncbi:unnamed protein product [Closterium sp. NIES-54]
MTRRNNKRGHSYLTGLDNWRRRRNLGGRSDLSWNCCYCGQSSLVHPDHTVAGGPSAAADPIAVEAPKAGTAAVPGAAAVPAGAAVSAVAVGGPICLAPPPRLPPPRAPPPTPPPPPPPPPPFPPFLPLLPRFCQSAAEMAAVSSKTDTAAEVRVAVKAGS